MNEPDRRPIPRTVVETDWGPLYASSTRGDAVRFTTGQLPALVQWLSTPPGQSLLREGARYDTAGLTEKAEASEATLFRLAGQVRDVRTTLRSGGAVSDGERRLLGELSSRLRDLDQRGLGAGARSVNPRPAAALPRRREGPSL